MSSKANDIRSLLCALFVVAASCTPATGRVIYVDDDAAGANDGSSWTDAFNYLQDALLTALAGDEIRVAQGIYTPTQNPLDREATFDLKNGVSIIGGHAGLSETYPDSRDTRAFATILSGDIDRNDDSVDPNTNNREGNSRHVVTCTGEGNSAVLEGVVITGGYAWPGQSHQRGTAEGGGLYCYRRCSPQVIDCVFTDNYSAGGGAVDISSGADPVFTRCIWQDNHGDSGAVRVSSGSHAVFTRCIWQDNEAENRGGAIWASRTSYLISLDHCIFRRNTAGRRGGAIYTDIMGEVRMVNCLFVGNTAGDAGGAISCLAHNDGTGRSMFTLVNCTFYGNTSPTFDHPPTNSLKQPDGTRVYWSDSAIANCIFYNSIANEVSGMPASFEFGRSEPLITNSIYERGSGQRGVIPPTPDPFFADPYGADGVLGTEDDDFHLSPISPGIDSGDPDYLHGPDETDLAGNPRIVNDRVDMGAYEFQGVIYVGEDGSDNPLGNGSERYPFGSIQQAIDVARDGHTVMVKPGVYGKIDFSGKAITVTSVDGAAVIKEPWNGRAGARRPDAVTFHTGEGPDSVLKNFIIKDAGMAISLNYGSSPTIRNLTIVDNNFGVAAYENSNPDISNCIFWNNKDGDLFQCQARYSCIESGAPGEGNISVDPLFVEEAGGDYHSDGDYHLRSEGHRWDRDAAIWIYDHITSPCIDAGDPASPLGDELMSVPRDPDNRYGLNVRINMGAFGGTSQASMPPLDWMVPDAEMISVQSDPTRGTAD